MRVPNRILSLLFVVACSFVVSACAQDFQGQVACSVDKDCQTPDKVGNLFPPDGGDPSFLPICCNKICALPAGGCESGFRYLTNDPSYGACIADPMCPAMPMPDLSMPNTD
jgi:hypothetical protein